MCGNKSDSSLCNPFCMSCWKGITRYSGPSCRLCGIPTASPLTTVCEACIKRTPPFSKILFYGIYEGALKESIHLLKFSGLKRLSKPLSDLLSELPVPESDGIVPVPLHPGRLRKREFNQTALLSRHLSKRLKIPLKLDVLTKVIDTPPQAMTSGKERLRNVRNAYRVSGEVAGMELLLVDDVITTGATARECAGRLIAAGAKNVTVAALARSMPRENI